MTRIAYGVLVFSVALCITLQLAIDALLGRESFGVVTRRRRAVTDAGYATHGVAIGVLGSSLVAYVLYLSWSALTDRLLAALAPLAN